MPKESEPVNHIRRLRFERAEMTQEELAAKVGVTRQTIIAIESGKYAPSLPLAFRIAQVFEMSIEEVFALNRNGMNGKAKAK